RYETANGFAMDVQRYLADEPVLACPPSAWYRLRKFARRNKGALVAALAFVVVLVSATAVSLGLATWALHAEAETSLALQQVTSAQQKTQAALDQVTAEQAKTQRALEAETKAREQTRQALNVLTDDVIETWFAKQTRLGDKEKAFLRKVLGFYQV